MGPGEYEELRGEDSAAELLGLSISQSADAMAWCSAQKEQGGWAASSQHSALNTKQQAPSAQHSAEKEDSSLNTHHTAFTSRHAMRSNGGIGSLSLPLRLMAAGGAAIVLLLGLVTTHVSTSNRWVNTKRAGSDTTPLELLQQGGRDLPTMLTQAAEASGRTGTRFEEKISRQMKKLIARAAKEEASANKEDHKGLALDTKAKSTCKIAQHLQDTDDGLEKRARTQREAATSLEGRAALLVTEANKETKAYEKLSKKGEAFRQNGQQLLELGTHMINKGKQLNGTTHSHEKAQIKAEGDKKEDEGGRLVATAHAVLQKANRHKANADELKAEADRTTAAAKATLQLGERFEKEAVSHRLKTMTYRSKCTMMKAKAEAALRKAQDEAKNAEVLDKIVKPAEEEHGLKQKSQN